MQTRTMKTLGAAALGVAFAAAAAGTASAAESAVPTLPGTDPTAVAGTLNTLPVGQVARTLPGGTQSTAAARQALSGATSTLPLAAGKGLPGGQNAGLLGGLPTGGLPLGG